MLSPRRAFNNHSHRVFVVLVILACAVCGACKSRPPAAPAVSPETWAVVDGREIKREEVDKAFRRVRDSSQAMAPEEEMTAKLGLLNDLITQDLLLAKATALKQVEPRQARVNKATFDLR